MKVFGVIAIVCVAAVAVTAFPQKKSEKDALRVQPELDRVDIKEYLRNDKLLDFQINCVLDKGPCDIVGRWIKPRVAGAVTTGQCVQCTEKQKLSMQTVITYVQEKRPEAFKEIMAKYLKEAGVTA